MSQLPCGVPPYPACPTANTNTNTNQQTNNKMADYSAYAKAGADTLGAVLGYASQRQDSNFGCGAKPGILKTDADKKRWQQCYDAALASQQGSNVPIAPPKDNTMRNFIIGGVVILAIGGIAFGVYKLVKK